MPRDIPKRPEGFQCYSTLKVSPCADLNVMGSAYRRQVLRYHPDKNKDPEALEIYQRIQESYEYLSNDACREEYERQVTVTYATACEELARSYNELRKIREKIQAEAPRNNAGTDVSQQSRQPNPNMFREQELLKLIINLTRVLLNLNCEIRVVPNPFAGIDLWFRMAQQYKIDIASLEQTIQNQRRELHLANMQIIALRGTVDNLFFKSENQKELVQIKTAEIDDIKKGMDSLRQKAAEAEDLKKQNRALKDEICKEKQRSEKIQDQNLDYAKLLRKENKDLKEQVKRQQEQLDEFKKMETELEVKSNTQRNLQMVREAQQRSQGGVNDVTMSFRSSIETTRAGKRPREFKRTRKGRPEEGGAGNLPTKRPRANEYVDPDDLFMLSLNIPSTLRHGGGLSLENDRSVGPAVSAAVIHKETGPEPG